MNVTKAIILGKGVSLVQEGFSNLCADVQHCDTVGIQPWHLVSQCWFETWFLYLSCSIVMEHLGKQLRQVQVSVHLSPVWEAIGNAWCMGNHMQILANNTCFKTVNSFFNQKVTDPTSQWKRNQIDATQ